MSTPVTLSVIIVSYNTRAMTLDCLQALFTELGSLSFESEVWVVDNASQDSSAAAIAEQFPEVRLIENEANLGFGAANNQAMRQACGEYFLLLNSDAFVRYEFENAETLEGGAIGTLLKYLEGNPAVALVGPRLLNADGSRQASCWRFPSPTHAWLENSGALFCAARVASPHSALSDPLCWEKPQQTRAHFIGGACFLVRRAVFEQSGGFDEDFPFYAEETDWQRRLCDDGWSLAFLPAAQVVHLGGASGARAEEQSTRLAARESAFAGLDRYTLKHHGKAGLISLRAATALGNFARALAWWLIGASTLLRPLRARRPIAMQRARLHSWLLIRQLTRWKW
jgi:GT2 family glycosyltransferase